MQPRSGVFVLQNDETLVAMQPTEFEKEVDFQGLLTRFPALLVGDQIDPENPRRFALVRQEQAIGHEVDANRWSVDHLFLDQDGIPTLVEVKRQSDTRIRREVVGQMLDYASNCQSFWSWEGIKAAFEATCAQAGSDADMALGELLDAGTSAETFWRNVKTNLQAGKLRMLIVADHIPSELRRIVEFLNGQMDPAEILAVELRQFTADGLRTLVPMVFGQTQKATKRKASPPGERWTEERLLATMDERFSAAENGVARAVLRWMKGTGLQLVFGTGRENGSVYPLMKPRGVAINPAYLSTEGRIWVQFKSLDGKPVFGDRAARGELLGRFAEVQGSGLKQTDVDGYPSLSLASVAADPRGLEKVLVALDWMLAQVTAADAREQAGR